MKENDKIISIELMIEISLFIEAEAGCLLNMERSGILNNRIDL